MPLDVGVIGLGNIGGGVARNLTAAGHNVVGYDIETSRIAAAGATPANDTGGVAAQSDLVMVAVASLGAYQETMAAIAASAQDGLVVGDLCTFPIVAKEAARAELAGAGATLLDCPVSGARPQSQAGELAMMVSGDEAAFRRVEDALNAFCRSVHFVGEFGVSAKLKYAINLMISIHNMTCAEGFLFAREAGIDLNLFADMVRDSAAHCRIFDIRAEKWISGDYDDPTAELAIQLKDKDIIADFATSMDCPTPMFNTTLPYYTAAASQGWTKKDAACILAVMEEMAGIPRGKV